MNRPLLVVAAVAVLASGCATRGSVRQVQTDVTALRQEITALRQLQEDSSREGARTLGEIKALDARLRDLNGAVAEATADVGRLKAQVAAAEASLARVRAELTARPAPVVSPPPAESRPREVAPRPGAAEAAYNGALATFRAREHGQAVLELLDFIAKYPRHPLAANAQYWIGEAYYVQRDYRQALVEFQKVLEYNSMANGKVADAMLKIGLCYTNLREPARAQEAWRRLLKEHPGSDAATRAQNLLRPRRTSTR